MSENIFEQLWEVDQKNSGLQPVSGVTCNAGQVAVNKFPDTSSFQPDHVLIPMAKFKTGKTKSYAAAERLFDNYNHQFDKQDWDSPEEKKEIASFVDLVIKSEVFGVAKAYLLQNQPTTFSQDFDWTSHITNVFFTIYKASQHADYNYTCAFEHVFIGEHDRDGKLGGYHYWYKYYADDMDREGATDDINFRTMKESQVQLQNPNSCTFNFSWKGASKSSKGGFLVGCSPEYLIACGTILHGDSSVSREFSIEGQLFTWESFFSGSNLRTFYAKAIRQHVDQ